MSACSLFRVAYIMKRYPRLSETFILNEIAVMEGLGASLALFSLLPPEPPPHHPMVREIKAHLHCLPLTVGQKALALARAHGACVLAAPHRYGHALFRAFYSSLQSRRPFSVWKQFLRAGFVADRCRREGVDLIHAHFANAPAAVAWFASSMSGIPYSFTTHAKDLYLTSRRVLHRRVHGAQFVTTCTRYNVDYLRSFLPAREHDKIHLVYHGINLDRFRKRKPADATGMRHLPLILSVGRLVPKKGFSDLIAACHILRNRGIGFRCVIVGEGPLRAGLEGEIAHYGLEGRVTLRGAMTHADLVSFYQEADIFALSARIVASGDRDGIPNVLAEAMASGIPVVSTSVSGIPELVRDNVTGLLVPSESPSSLAEALSHLIGHPQTGMRLAQAARAVLEAEFDCLETTKHLRDLMYGRCCADERHPTLAEEVGLPSALAAHPAAE